MAEEPHDLIAHNLPLTAYPHQIWHFLDDLASRLELKIVNYYEPIINNIKKDHVSAMGFFRLDQIERHLAFKAAYADDYRPWYKGRGLRDKPFLERINFSSALKTCREHDEYERYKRREPPMDEIRLSQEAFRSEAALTAHLRRAYLDSLPVQSSAFPPLLPSILKPAPGHNFSAACATSLPPLRFDDRRLEPSSIGPLLPPTIWDEATGRLLPPSHQKPQVRAANSQGCHV